eukprot:819930-Amphidinium_carterae.4
MQIESCNENAFVASDCAMEEQLHGLKLWLSLVPWPILSRDEDHSRVTLVQWAGHGPHLACHWVFQVETPCSHQPVGAQCPTSFSSTHGAQIPPWGQGCWDIEYSLCTGIALGLHYIPSRLNPADFPSRGRPVPGRAAALPSWAAHSMLHTAESDSWKSSGWLFLAVAKLLVLGLT